MRAAWVVLALVACGDGTSDKERRVCEHAAKLCDEPASVAECVAEMPEAKQAMGDAYGAFLDCGIAAKSCGEYVGCAIGGAGGEAMKQIDGLRRGMEKMLDEQMPDVRDRDDRRRGRSDDLGELPPECARVRDVCSGIDARSAASQCSGMIGNLRADPENRAKLGRCIAGVKNCYALEKCVSDLWFELH